MATLSEMVIAQGLKGSTETPNVLGAAETGAKIGSQLAEHVAQVQQRKEALEQQKSQQEIMKLDKIGGLFEAAAKMPEGAARKAFLNDFIPNAVNALGYGDKINPTVQKMMNSEPMVVPYLKAKLIDGSIKLPEVYDALANPEKMASFMAKSNLAQFGGEEALRTAVTENSEGLMKAYDRATIEGNKDARAATIAGNKANQQGIGNLQDLRKEYTGHPTTKKSFEVADSYSKIRSTLGGKGSAAGDMTGIFSLMKMLDPGSTVREGEYATAKQAGGIPDRIWGAYNKAIDGQILTPSQRKDFLSQAGKIYKSQYDAQKKVDQDYMDVARSTGLNPKLVITGNRMKAPAPESSGEMRTIPADKMEALRALPPGAQAIAIEGLAERLNTTAKEIRKQMGAK